MQKPHCCCPHPHDDTHVLHALSVHPWNDSERNGDAEAVSDKCHSNERLPSKLRELDSKDEGSSKTYRLIAVDQYAECYITDASKAEPEDGAAH